MKNFIVFSDVHGDFSSFEKLLNFASKNDGLFFAGDGNNFFSSIQKNENYFYVKGNCDQTGIDEKIVEIDGVKILLVHGHNQGVKSGYLRLQLYAKQKGVSVVIFGHTHIPFVGEEDGLLMINPGTCSYYGMQKTYACLCISNGKASAYINLLK